MILIKPIFNYLFVLLVLTSPALMAEDRAQLDCLVKPGMYIDLSSPVDAIIEKVYVNIGDYVKKGQRLVQLESSIEIAKVELAKLQAKSDIEIKNSKVQLKYAKRNNERLIALYAKKNVSQFEKDKAKTEVVLAEIELIKAKEKKRIAGLNLKLAKAQYALRTIRSPINGLVVDRYAMIGETVKDRALMKLAQVDPLRIELIAPTEYFGLIDNGMEVDIYPERPVGHIFKAVVIGIDQVIDPASGSFTVRLALPNSDKKVTNTVKLVVGVNCMAKFDFPTP